MTKTEAKLKEGAELCAKFLNGQITAQEWMAYGKTLTQKELSILLGTLDLAQKIASDQETSNG